MNSNLSGSVLRAIVAFALLLTHLFTDCLCGVLFRQRCEEVNLGTGTFH